MVMPRAEPLGPVSACGAWHQSRAEIDARSPNPRPPLWNAFGEAVAIGASANGGKAARLVSRQHEFYSLGSFDVGGYFVHHKARDLIGGPASGTLSAADAL